MLCLVRGVQGGNQGVWSFPDTTAPLARTRLLLVGSTLLGGRVVQAHVLLARSSAHHTQVLGHAVISEQPLLSDLRVFARLREVLPKRKEKRVLCSARLITSPDDYLSQLQVPAGSVAGTRGQSLKYSTVTEDQRQLGLRKGHAVPVTSLIQ